MDNFVNDPIDLLFLVGTLISAIFCGVALMF
jgi:hypothetical protein